MQNSSISLTNWRTDSSYSNIVQPPSSTVTVSPYSSGRTMSFSFTGFGPNSDPKKKLPVSGTYERIDRTQMYGEIFKYEPWSGGTFQSTASRGNVSGLVSAWPDYYFSYISASSLVSNNLMNWAYNDALSKLWTKIKASETNIALTLGEGKESLKTLGSAKDLLLQQARKLNKSLVAVSKLKKHIRREATRYLTNPTLTLAQTHLSVKYGWLPLINDVWNYADWSYKTFSFGTPFKARSTKRINISEPWTDSTGYSLVKGFESYRCEIEVVCYVNDASWFTASRLSSFNPATIAWELTTLSFVVDWLYDIGSYLENLENALGTGLTFRRGYVTRVAFQESKHEHFRKKKTLNGAGFYTTESGYASCTYRKVVKRRDVLTGFPWPVKPTLKLRMGGGRIMSAAALSRTVLLGKVRGSSW